mmetsp:Transcript_926/g.2141  ORF Transcript_926/g.2141 Transcript_926/m.2141 type:complete len:295 (-) Transcript_926:259-1143(-)
MVTRPICQRRCGASHQSSSFSRMFVVAASCSCSRSSSSSSHSSSLWLWAFSAFACSRRLSSSRISLRSPESLCISRSMSTRCPSSAFASASSPSPCPSPLRVCSAFAMSCCMRRSASASPRRDMVARNSPRRESISDIAAFSCPSASFSSSSSSASYSVSSSSCAWSSSLSCAARRFTPAPTRFLALRRSSRKASLSRRCATASRASCDPWTNAVTPSMPSPFAARTISAKVCEKSFASSWPSLSTPSNSGTRPSAAGHAGPSRLVHPTKASGIAKASPRFARDRTRRVRGRGT